MITETVIRFYLGCLQQLHCRWHTDILRPRDAFAKWFPRSCLFCLFVLPFIYFLIFFFFLAMLSLPSCVDFSLVEVSGGHSLVAVHELLIVVASLIAEHKL